MLGTDGTGIADLGLPFLALCNSDVGINMFFSVLYLDSLLTFFRSVTFVCKGWTDNYVCATTVTQSVLSRNNYT